MSNTYKKLLTDFFKKSIFVQILLLIALIGIIYFLKIPFYLSSGNSANPATLVINFETEKRVFEGEVVKDMTILDALNAAVSVGKIKLSFAIDKSGNVNIMEIDSHANGTDGKYFVFYINSKKVAAKELHRETIHSGDRVEIEFK